jgi:hypothetical protein
VSVNSNLYVINAPRTLIKNTYIKCEGCYGGVQVRAEAPSSDDVTIQDTTITADANNWMGVYNLGVKNLTMLRLDISKTGGGVQTSTTGGWTLRDSYIHDLTQASDQHMNGLQSSGGGNVTLIHNTIFNSYPFTDAVMLAVDPGGSEQVNDLVQNNLLAGGGYTIYGGSTGSGCANPCTTSNIRILDNRISRLYYPNGGSYGPVTAFNTGDPGNVWSGNVWDDTGTAITP